MRSYFVTYLLPVAYTEAELAGLKDGVLGLVAKHKGKVTTTDEWGKKKLAYKIKHAGKWQTEAHYVHLTVELEPDQVQALEQDLYLQPAVIRHLVVKAE